MRLRPGVALILAAVGLTVLGNAAEPMTLREYMALNGPAPTVRIPYGPEPSQFVELFEPVGRGPFPVAVLIHGGCFLSKFEGLQQMRGMAGALAERGIAVWNVEYRRSDEAGGGYPGTYMDAISALDLLQDRAGQYGLDTRRVVAVGHSAGGYLAIWAAGRQQLPIESPLHRKNPAPVRKVVSLGMAKDMSLDPAAFKDLCGIEWSRLVGLPASERPDVNSDTSILRLMPRAARIVFINGEFDAPDEAKAFAVRVRKLGSSADTVMLPGASHLQEVATSSSSWPLVLQAILESLDVRR